MKLQRFYGMEGTDMIKKVYVSKSPDEADGREMERTGNLCYWCLASSQTGPYSAPFAEI